MFLNPAFLVALSLPAVASGAGDGGGPAQPAAVPAPGPSSRPSSVVSSAAPPSGASPPAPEPAGEFAWQVRLSVSTVTPAALPGLAVGGAADLSRRLFSGPLFLSVQLGLTSASAANESWIIDHRQLLLAAGLGARARVGVGQVWGQLGAGATGIEEVLSRHQLERIQTANVGGGTQTSFAAGPYGFAELGVTVRLRGAFSASLSAGPALSRMMIAGQAAWQPGAFARMGGSYEF